MHAIRPVDEQHRRVVLVADDEPAIQAMVARVIVQTNLVPIVVSDGAAAITVVEAHRDELVCAILDITMPGANGVDAAHVIQLIAPDLPITLMSGAIPTTYAGRITSLRLAGTLQKPFPLAVLRALILHAVTDGVAHEKSVERSNA